MNKKQKITNVEEDEFENCPDWQCGRNEFVNIMLGILIISVVAAFIMWLGVTILSLTG
ncbi:MAG: hypothetical protein ACRC1M_03680 [Methanobacteriaceae archaeon]